MKLASIYEKLNDLLTRKTPVDSLVPLPSTVCKLLALKPVVEELFTTVASVQATLDSFTKKYNFLLALAMENENSVRELQTELSLSEQARRGSPAKLPRCKESSVSLSNTAADVTWGIHGLPFVQGEDLIRALQNLSHKLSITSFQRSKIRTIQCLPVRSELHSKHLGYVLHCRANEMLDDHAQNTQMAAPS